MENLTAFVRERSRRNEAERTSQDLEQRVSRRAYFLWRRLAGQTGGLKTFGRRPPGGKNLENRRQQILPPF